MTHPTQLVEQDQLVERVVPNRRCSTPLRWEDRTPKARGVKPLVQLARVPRWRLYPRIDVWHNLRIDEFSQAVAKFRV
jgi:hypothetical protein